MKPLPWLALLLVLALPAVAATLPGTYTLARVAEGWVLHEKGVQLGVEARVGGTSYPGTLSLMGGRYHLDLGEQGVRVFDGTRLKATGVTALSGVPAALPEGLLLQPLPNLTSMLEEWGITLSQGAPGHIPTPDEALPFVTVLRYGLPPGPDNLGLPQLAVEPHSWRVRRVVTGDPAVRVEWGGYGKLTDAPWIPQTMRVWRGEDLIWSLTVTSLLASTPSSSLFVVSGP